jgi:uncharacterized protein involved in outer membrane biogenesis
MTRLSDKSPASRKQSKTRLLVLGGFLAILAIPAAIIAIMVARFDPNQYAPAIIAAVNTATGRQLTLGGPITLEISLTPRIVATNLSLSNPAGFADPYLLKLSRVEAQVALLPLLSHRVDVLKLVLVNPVITMESGPKGDADWDFSAPNKAKTPASLPSATSNVTPNGYKIAIEAVEIENGILTIKDATSSSPVTISLPQLRGTADSVATPLILTANAVLGDTPFSITGVVGPIERFSGVGDGPWPVDLALQMAGATARLQGNVMHPRTAQGYDLALKINIPALESVLQSLPASLLSGYVAPPIHNLSIAARIVDQKSVMPAIDDLTIIAGVSDLSSIRPGLKLSELDAGMASLDKPFAIHATGTLGNTPISLSGNFGPLQALLNRALLPASMPPQGSFPVTISSQIGAATLGITGAIATPETLAGAALAVNASIPDLSALSAFAGQPLPVWKNISLQTTLIDPGGLGLRNAAGLDGLTASMDNAALGGAASIYFGAQPRLQVALKISQLDLDALLAAIPPATPPTTPPATPTLPAQTPTAPLMFSNSPFPLALLKTASADIQVSADSMTWNHATYMALQGHAVLSKGILTLSPVSGQLPGGTANASASLDATQEPAVETLQITAPALALAPFLKAFGLSDTAQGTVQAQLSASGTGDSAHAFAASMNGQLGLAMVNGVVDGAVMQRLFGTVLNTVELPANLVGAQGPVAVRCAALRLDTVNGTGTVRTLTLDSSRLLLQGSGNIDFGNETLAIILRPQARVAGASIGVPVQLGGSFEAPTTSVAPLGALKGTAQSAAGVPINLAQQVFGSGSALGQAAGILGIGDSGDVCPAALNLGRMGQAGPSAPAISSPPLGASLPKLTGPKNLLNALLGK